MVANPLLEAFRNQGNPWAGPLLAVLDDFERRLQELGSEPGDAPVSYHDSLGAEYLPGNGGSEDESNTESSTGNVPD